MVIMGDTMHESVLQARLMSRKCKRLQYYTPAASVYCLATIVSRLLKQPPQTNSDILLFSTGL
uniref:Uncharacterized protein n=1 Tax=Arundo donax TaxID=35708 RepID=A0A0A8YU46_ARUDO